MRARLLIVLAVAALAATAFAPAMQPPTPGVAAADDWTDADYRDHDVDNYTRARGRMIAEGTDPAYHRAFVSACLDSQGRSVLKQANEALNGRIYGGVGQATCWWSVGDAPDYFDVSPTRVRFLARTGAKLQGHVWGLEHAGERPGVVITTGSIQASDQMYWWAARALAAAGYVVLTYDVQGQGQSETFSHGPGDPVPGTTNVPSQQDANFHDGTVDTMEFLLSTPEDPYVPIGWSDDDVAAAREAAADEDLDWVNPGAGVLDHDNIGIIGHSLGASAVSNVQQCSDEGELWREVEVCQGRSYPIRAVVGWDALSSGVTPVVPGMSQNSDGYFLFPSFEPQGVEIGERSGLGAFDTWVDAGLDSFVYTGRGETHISWSQVPYTSATTYGVHTQTYYTLAWLHRWVWPDDEVNAAAHERLVNGPLADPEDPSRSAANYFSVRAYSGLRLTSPEEPDQVTYSDDLRHEYAGLSAIGDWAGANKDTAGRVLP